MFFRLVLQERNPYLNSFPLFPKRDLKVDLTELEPVSNNVTANHVPSYTKFSAGEMCLSGRLDLVVF